MSDDAMEAMVTKRQAARTAWAVYHNTLTQLIDHFAARPDARWSGAELAVYLRAERDADPRQGASGE